FFARIDVFGGVFIAAVGADVFLVRLFRVHAVAVGFQHLAYADKFVADGLVVLIQRNRQDVTFGQLQIANTLGSGGEDGADLGAQALAQILQAGADRQAVLRESGLGSAVGQLFEDFTHG